MAKSGYAFIPALLLAVALLPLPYGYYQLLRIAVTGWALFLIWRETNGGTTSTPWIVPFVLIGLVFNPVFKVTLAREVWVIVDFISAIVFAGYGLKSKRREA